MADVVYKGADGTFELELTNADQSFFVVAADSTVTASLYDPWLHETVSAVKTIQSTDDQNDWGIGIVAFTIPASETAQISEGVYGIEVKVVGDETFKTQIPYAVEVRDTAMA